MNDAVTRCLGLITQFNPLATSPGALVKADNCVVDRENIVEDRRGYASYLALNNAVTQLFVYQNKVIAHNGTVVSIDNSGTPIDYVGSYNAPSGQKMRSVEAFQNCYVTTDVGVQVFTDVAGTAARKAGSPRSLDGSYALNAAGTGFLATAFQCAYRFVIQRTDANSNILSGYPSTRMWVVNASGVGKNIDITLPLPSEVTVLDVIQVYRTAQVSGTSSDSAGDEMALVYQVNPTSSQVASGTVTFTDIVVDALRGASLYTSPSQEGINGANERPPLCKDLALYKNDFLVYANTSTPQRLFLTLVGTSGLTGNTITLAGTTYSFGVTEVVGSGTAAVGATGVAAADIDTTARSLVKVINRYTSNTTVYAYYLSGPSDLPGQILIQERGVGAAAFTVQSSNTTINGMFYPGPPVSPATNTQSTSSNSVQKNALFIAKSKQPEAVPLLNYRFAGAANKNILRVAPLRNSLVIIKEEGVYLLTGDDFSSFTITPLDLTVFCKSADSVAVLSNEVVMLSNQGVVAITETGVQVISRDIETDLKPLLGYSNISSYATGVAYQSDRSYLLSVMTSKGDLLQNQIYRYNLFTKTWTHWTFGFGAAVIESGTDKMYFSKPGDTNVYQERKDFADTDFADPEVSITITSLNSTTKTVVFTISGATPLPGWVIQQNSVNLAIKSLVGNAGVYTCVMQAALPTAWATGAALLFPSVGYDVVYDCWTGQGMAAVMKQVSEVAILTDDITGKDTATALTVTFRSSFDEASEEIPIYYPTGGWGDAWGVIPWGGVGNVFGYRMYVPRTKQWCTRLNVGVKHPNALEKLSCAGFAVTYEPLSERIGK